MTITPLKVGQAYRFNAFILDITLRKRAQEQARQHQLELAHVIRLSTMGKMVSGIAHEIHQPLTAISNYVQVCIQELRCGEWDTPQLIATNNPDRGATFEFTLPTMADPSKAWTTLHGALQNPKLLEATPP